MSRIAIVDDSRLIRVFAAAALKASGYETVEVEPTSLGGVLRVLRESQVDLLLADCLMPGCPGENLIKACREDAVLHDLPILVLSAHRDEASLLRMQQLGISGFLAKPMEASVLAAKVDEALAG
jgi:DNA-binding NarL/FixJ family response regulator